MAGLLVLTLPFKQLCFHLPQVIGGACSKVSEVLYVHFDPASTKPPSITDGSIPSLSVKEASYIIQNVYSHSLLIAPTLDIRILMGGFKGHFDVPVDTKCLVKRVMVDMCPKEHLYNFVKRYEGYLKTSNPILFMDDALSKDNLEINFPENIDKYKIYKNIVAGGTFDRMHVGHKILVSEGLLRCTNKFTIGMADGPLLAKKVLSELIEPVDTRISKMRNFLEDIDPTVQYRLEPIYEPLGPSGEDPDMEMIIVSQETLKGGNYVNSARNKRGLSTLDVSVIDIIDDPSRIAIEEQKVSSSSTRMRLLGSLLKPRKKNITDYRSSFIIGLTGGSASGKSTLARKIKDLGAGIIDCDKLGHKAYLKGSVCYTKLIDTFGSQILTDEEEIDRKELGALVFNDKTKLELLNSLIWPEILLMVEEEIADLRAKNVKIILLDAAVLMEAKWDTLCNEVWVCTVPKAEAVRRICSRDGCTEEQARQRLSNQLSNKERIDNANVVFCTMWASQYTDHQLGSSWERLIVEGIGWND